MHHFMPIVHSIFCFLLLLRLLEIYQEVLGGWEYCNVPHMIKLKIHKPFWPKILL